MAANPASATKHTEEPPTLRHPFDLADLHLTYVRNLKLLIEHAHQETEARNLEAAR